MTVKLMSQTLVASVGMCGDRFIMMTVDGVSEKLITEQSNGGAHGVYFISIQSVLSSNNLVINTMQSMVTGNYR